MGNHKLGRALSGIVTVGDPANDFKLVDADSLPTGTVYKNLVADALSVTVAKVSTGKYTFTCTPSVGASFAAGDRVSVTITATVGGNNYDIEVANVVMVADDPAEAGDEMDLVDAPNNTAITAIQNGLATGTNVSDAEDNIRGADGDTLESLSDQIDGTSTLAAQDIADALKLAPTAGAPAADSVNADLDTLKTNVDQKLSTMESNIRGADSDTLETLSDQLDTVQSTVSNISNVTRLSRAVPSYFTRPSAGNTAILIEVALKDANGNMQDPDGNQLAMTVYNASGTSRDAQLFKEEAFSNALDAGSGTFLAYKKLVRAATGLYYCYYQLASDAAEETLTFKFGWEENASALYEYSASQVTDATNDINLILSQTQKLTFDGSNRIIADARAISASTAAADSLEANIGNLDQAISATESNIRGIDADTLKTIADDIASLLSQVAKDATVAKTGADGDTLETLSDQIDLQATAIALAACKTILDKYDAMVEQP